MTFIIQNFGPNLARLRIEKGVSQTQLAEDLGIGKQSISDYEKQKSYPTFANLDKTMMQLSSDTASLKRYPCPQNDRSV